MTEAEADEKQSVTPWMETEEPALTSPPKRGVPGAVEGSFFVAMYVVPSAVVAVA